MKNQGIAKLANMQENLPNVEFRESEVSDIGFEIIELEQLHERAKDSALSHIYQPHRVHFHNIILFEKGQGNHTLDFREFPVSQDDIVLVSKGQVHAFDKHNELGGKVILFTENFVKGLLSSLGIRLFSATHFFSKGSQNFKLSRLQTEVLLKLVEQITTEFSSEQLNIAYLKTMFVGMLIKISEAKPASYQGQLNTYQSDCFERFMALLESNTFLMRDANSFAAEIGTTYKTLNKICKLASNQTAKQLVDGHTILEAKRQLTVENIQVQQLSEKLGFDEPSNFVKYFKKHVLLTPYQFKKLKG